MQIYDQINGHFSLPFQGYNYQVQTINHLGQLYRQGHYLDLGLGKTYTATCCALYKLMTKEVDHVIVIMPPILLKGWFNFLSGIPEIKALVYQGTPTQRRVMPLGKTEFTLMSYQIFKGDNEYLQSKLKNLRVAVIADEASALKNIGTVNHKSFCSFTVESPRLVLTGTPITTPMDGYAFCKMIAPGVYRNQNQFRNIHVASVDFFGNVTEWRELDLLANNMKINAVRLIADEVLEDLPDVTYTRVPYDLDPKHLRLYNTLADEQLLLLESGGKVDATSAPKLYNTLQQIVLNWDHFAENPMLASAGIELLDQAVEQCNGRKLVVCANYRMSNRKLVKHLAKYRPVAIFGDNSATQNRQSVETFIENDDCRVLVMQPTSGGYGVDGLQHVCRDMLFLEAPVIPRDFHQTVGRLRRNGQKHNVNVMIATAEKTIQVRLLNNLLNKDQLINTVVPSARDLRDALHGL